ncbi:elongation factor P maturation arginine rhamnosyltransferase EarP [uncultured Treponema sp.]|uniref:elongation factor P maturation arginine rhamnosyltransferase EarP n=1 Tax=uncultured Treponema sp. TaxID=162155 RepID=UPI00260D8337|nr:elongation factor P maturation arginine rhamnosyltransferase EarP [uncultured Treponema sp.]
MEITVLCRVVDNFGDIGVVFRLCRALSELKKNLEIRLVVSNLDSFAKISKGIDSAKSFQEFHGWKIFDWNDNELCKKEFSRNPPEFILECFQCGRPEWLEEILFFPQFNLNVQIVNIEYLTAESWADDFHLLKSGTRSAKIKKINFMPGFTKKTGGLILDKNFMCCLSEKKYALNLAKQNLDKKILSEDFSASFKIFVFSYPKNFDFLASAIKEFSLLKKVLVFIAPGAGSDSAKNSLEKFSVDFILLPFMQQEVWDAFLSLMDFSFVRGEDSFSRCCLLGNPFVWNIYPQEDEFHIVKLDAFLKRIKIPQIEKFSFLYNRNFKASCCLESLEILKEKKLPSEIEEINLEMKNEILSLLKNSEKLKPEFKKFSNEILKNGNLAENLLSFLETKIPR